jgi:hypothetical protein
MQSRTNVLAVLVVAIGALGGWLATLAEMHVILSAILFCGESDE